ncbi:hypothetical protein [Microvirga sp. Mcv34]|uniref:hypothetical protein n=1 Tax=Microvirga sp. Mcv34 TaxID=2926016 RepID=UPI0021C8E5DF|nr:hypothetical protein [Microvirga sp. Mcv34]
MNASSEGNPHPAARTLSWSSFAWLVLGVALAMPAAARAQVLEPFQKVDGLAVYLGVMPGRIVRGHPTGHTETAMHGGSPHDPDTYHLVVALFDATSGARVEDADVSASVSGLGHVGTQRLKLEPMSIAATVTYGGFVQMPPRDRYTIRLEVRRRGAATPAKADFVFAGAAR